MIRRAVLLAAAIQMAGAGSVLANHFPPLSQIKVGAKLALYQPEILLLLAVCGLAISYWGRRDALIGFAAFLAGVLLGFPVVFIWQIDMVWLALILTLLFGATVALHLFLPKRMQQAYWSLQVPVARRWPSLAITTKRRRGCCWAISFSPCCWLWPRLILFAQL